MRVVDGVRAVEEGEEEGEEDPGVVVRLLLRVVVDELRSMLLLQLPHGDDELLRLVRWWCSRVGKKEKTEGKERRWWRREGGKRRGARVWRGERPGAGLIGRGKVLQRGMALGTRVTDRKSTRLNSSHPV